jgi:hypothetical protein
MATCWSTAPATSVAPPGSGPAASRAARASAWPQPGTRSPFTACAAPGSGRPGGGPGDFAGITLPGGLAVAVTPGLGGMGGGVAGWHERDQPRPRPASAGPRRPQAPTLRSACARADRGDDDNDGRTTRRSMGCATPGSPAEVSAGQAGCRCAAPAVRWRAAGAAPTTCVSSTSICS